jgi:hypothetical protein
VDVEHDRAIADIAVGIPPLAEHLAALSTSNKEADKNLASPRGHWRCCPFALRSKGHSRVELAATTPAEGLPF